MDPARAFIALNISWKFSANHCAPVIFYHFSFPSNGASGTTMEDRRKSQDRGNIVIFDQETRRSRNHSINLHYFFLVYLKKMPLVMFFMKPGPEPGHCNEKFTICPSFCAISVLSPTTSFCLDEDFTIFPRTTACCLHTF